MRSRPSRRSPIASARTGAGAAHSDPATTLRHYVRLTTAARAKAVAGLDAAQALRAEEDGAAPSDVVALAGRRGRAR